LPHRNGRLDLSPGGGPQQLMSWGLGWLGFRGGGTRGGTAGDGGATGGPRQGGGGGKRPKKKPGGGCSGDLLWFLRPRALGSVKADCPLFGLYKTWWGGPGLKIPHPPNRGFPVAGQFRALKFLGGEPGELRSVPRGAARWGPGGAARKTFMISGFSYAFGVHPWARADWGYVHFPPMVFSGK